LPCHTSVFFPSQVCSPAHDMPPVRCNAARARPPVPEQLTILAGSRPFALLRVPTSVLLSRSPPSPACYHLGSPHLQSTSNGRPPCNGHQRWSYCRTVCSPRSVHDSHVQHPLVKFFSHRIHPCVCVTAARPASWPCTRPPPIYALHVDTAPETFAPFNQYPLSTQSNHGHQW
jgi:hypothetical protein